jgi:asparagine synthetase B (glutamine-hydrolysing)
MCGIAGVVLRNSNLNPSLIQRMCDVLQHRGPDDESYLAVDTLNCNAHHLMGSQSQVSGKRIEYFNGNADLLLGSRRPPILDTSMPVYKKRA